MNSEKPWRPGQGQSIDAVYAWIATEPDGGEGLVSAQFDFAGQPTHMPLIGADMERVRSLRSYAEATRKMTGYPVRLVRFGSRDDLEILP